MERRPFGSTKRDVAVIGQGTWYLDQADRALYLAKSAGRNTVA